MSDHMKNEVFKHKMKINKNDRSNIKRQKPCVIWFTGLSGSGKSTVADILEQKLILLDKHTYLLDGDNIRHSLNSDLSFSNEDRDENIRRIGHLAELMIDAGLIVIAAFISPFKRQRNKTRSLFNENEFIEVFMDTPIEVCEKRDPKGLYEKARSGLIKDFTGIDSVYEKPDAAEITLNGLNQKPEGLADLIINYLSKKNII